MAELADARWRKSSFSGDNMNCVEVARVGDVVGLRDSKDVDGGVVTVSASAFDAFVTGLKQDRLSREA